MFCNGALFISIIILGVYTVDSTFFVAMIRISGIGTHMVAYEILTLEVVFK